MYTERTIDWNFVPHTTSELLRMNKLSQPCDAETICKIYDETFASHFEANGNKEFKNYIRAIEDKLQFKVIGLKFCGFGKKSLDSLEATNPNLVLASSAPKVFLCINNDPFPVANVSIYLGDVDSSGAIFNKQFESPFTHSGGHYSKHTSRVITKMKDYLREYTLTDVSELWDGIATFHRLCSKDMVDVAYMKLKNKEEKIGFRRRDRVGEPHPLMDTFKNILKSDASHSAQHLMIKEYVDAFNSYQNCNTNLTSLKSVLVYTKTDQNNFQWFKTQRIEFTDTSWKLFEPATIYSVDSLPEEILNSIYALSVLPSCISKMRAREWGNTFSNRCPWNAQDTLGDCFSSSIGLHVGEGIYYVIL